MRYLIFPTSVASIKAAVGVAGRISLVSRERESGRIWRARAACATLHTNYLTLARARYAPHTDSWARVWRACAATPFSAGTCACLYFFVLCDRTLLAPCCKQKIRIEGGPKTRGAICGQGKETRVSHLASLTEMSFKNVGISLSSVFFFFFCVCARVCLVGAAELTSW